MRFFILVFSILLIAVFVAVNWTVFAASTELNLVLFSIVAPLGLTLLGLTVVVTLVFAVYMAIWQGKILKESRRQSKELQTQRALADEAELSRFTELRGVMQAEFAKLTDLMSQSQDRSSKELRDNTNSLAAMLGEMDDRVNKRSGDSTALPRIS